MYPPEIVSPMRQELSKVGFQQLESVEAVEQTMKKKDTTLVVINSVCGCAAANARPGVIESLQNKKTPETLVTVFAGVDREATDKMRTYMTPFPPSSPSIGLFKNGELVHMLERHHIEGRPAAMIAENLAEAYSQYC